MTKLIESNYEMVNGKYYLLLETGKRPSDEVTDNPNDIASLGGENISEEGFMKFDNVRYITKKYFNTINKGKIQKEDILINKDGAQTGKIAYISEIPFEKSMINEHIFIIRNNGEFDQKFLFYFLLSFKGQKQIKSKIVGSAQGGISNSFIKGLYLPKPKKSTQEKIASILSTVDKNIEQTKKTIEKTEKLKKSMMHNLLTGKIKPDGSKRREEEFYIDDKFGKVPKGWELKFIGDSFVSIIEPNYSFKKGKQYDFLPMEAVLEKSQGISYFSKRKIETGGLCRFKNNDILFAKITPCTENGKIALVEKIKSELGFGSTEFIVISPSKNIISKYLYNFLLLNRIHGKAVSLMEGTTGRQRVPLSIFKKNLKICFPKDLSEQKEIVEKLEIYQNKIKVNNIKILKLQKLKKSLMQNLLTGKIEVK